MGRAVLIRLRAAAADLVETVFSSFAWNHTTGSAKIINFDVWNAPVRYQLSFNTQDLSWKEGLTVID